MNPTSSLAELPVVSPLFGSSLVGQPHVFDFTSNNPRTLSYDPAQFTEFQSAVYGELAASGRAWGIGRYKEERANVLRHYPQMIREGRVYHAGIDITSLPGTPLYAPLDAVVWRIGKEEGVGNYGGFVILQHHTSFGVFYSFYGHLLSRHCIREGQRVGIGERFAVIGDGSDSGGWFTHTHLQIITERAVYEGRTMHGYVCGTELSILPLLFPDPSHLLRY